MVFTRHEAGKIWLSLCIQYIAKLGLHYQINMINLTRFVYQICMMKILNLDHRGVLRT